MSTFFTDTKLRLYGPPVLFVVGTVFFRLNTLVDFDYAQLYKYDLIGILAGYLNWHIARWLILYLQRRYAGISQIRRRVTVYALLLPLLLTSATLIRTEPFYWLSLDQRVGNAGSWFSFDTAGSNYFRRYLLTVGIQFFHHCVYLGVYEGLYLYGQWRQLYREKDRLLKAEWQARFSAISSRVNPHFLFNALNSLSALIAEEPLQAELFVDKLSSVYRYMLQAAEQPIITLDAELRFIDAYYHLLKTRYGNGLTLTIRVDEAHRTCQIPPFTLQLLVENAVKHNIVSPKRPLHIQIVSHGQALLVQNTLQRKQIRVLSNGIGLANIHTKYRLLNLPSPVIDEGEGEFRVTLPLQSSQHQR